MRRLTLTLTRRKDGRWAKKIDGEYMVWPDEKTARAEVIEIARRRAAGNAELTVSSAPPDPPLRVIANLFRQERKPHVQPGTWTDYETAIDQFLASVGKNRFASSLTPNDFAKVRKGWEGSLGPWKIDNRIQSVRTMFRWAFQVGRLIEREPWYGDAFRKTSQAEKRAVRREHEAKNGERLFTRDELRTILAHVGGQLRCFILLALNGGLYARDISDLRPEDIRKDGRFAIIDNDRRKTGVRRKFVLWPETLAEIEANRQPGERLFLTYHGNPWVTDHADSIGLLFRRLLNDLGIKRGGVGFGSLRHTHVSAVGDHPDINACRLVRGHSFRSQIETHYDFPDTARIKAVTDLARARLLTSVLRKPTPRAGAPKRPPAARQRAGSAERTRPGRISTRDKKSDPRQRRH